MNIAAYCRVSTDKEDQLNSLEIQKEFFLEYTKRTGDNLIKLYADEGISGTKIKNRKEFQRMLADDALQELDKDLIPNLDNLTPEVKNLPYDPDNTYSVPYFWGSVGIIYNHNNVDPAEVEEQGFDILRNPKYKGHI